MTLSKELQECLLLGTKTSLLFMPLAQARKLVTLKSDKESMECYIIYFQGRIKAVFFP